MYMISEDSKEFLTNSILDAYDYIRERDGLWYEPSVNRDEKDTYELTELLGECLVILDELSSNNNNKGILKMNDVTDTKAEVTEETIQKDQPMQAEVKKEEVKAEVQESKSEEVAAINDNTKDPEDVIA